MVADKVKCTTNTQNNDLLVNFRVEPTQSFINEAPG